MNIRQLLHFNSLLSDSYTLFIFYFVLSFLYLKFITEKPNLNSRRIFYKGGAMLRIEIIHNGKNNKLLILSVTTSCGII